MPGPGFRAGTAHAEVRPSLDEFQQDMERQLREIRSRYEVPVDAKVDPAQAIEQGTRYGTTFGERARQSIDKALAAIGDPNLGANAAEAEAKISELKRQYESAFRDAKANLDTREFDADLTRLDSELQRLTRDRVARIAIGGDTAKVEADIDRLKDEYEEIFRRRHELQVSTAKASADVQALNAQLDAAVEDRRAVDFDIAPAERKLAQLRANLEEMRDRASQVTAANANQFLADLDRNRAAMAQLAGGRDFDLGGQSFAGSETSVLVRAETGQAIAEIDALRSYASRDVEMNVRVDSSGMSSFLSGLATAGQEMSNLQRGMLLLGPMVVPLGAALLGGAGGLLTGLPLAIAGIGTLTLGLGGIKEALKANESMQAQSGATARTSAAEQAAAARQQQAHAMALTNAEEGVTNAVARLANARSAAASGAERAAARVEAAERAAADGAVAAAARVDAARRAAADGAANAASRVTSAERSLESAQRAERTAQIALTDARIAAREQLQLLTFSIADNALAARSGEIRLREARQKIELDRQQHITGLQLEKDQLALDEATQQLLETQYKGQQLAADKAEADRNGIEGSKGVVAAQEGVTRSQEGTERATQSLVDALRAQVAQQIDGQEKIAAAIQAQAAQQAQASEQIAAAKMAQAEQSRSADASIASALQGVESAQRSLERAQLDAAPAAEAAAKGADAYAAAMAKLTPAGRAFVEFYLSELKPRFEEMRETAAAGLLPGLQEGARRAEPGFASLRRLIGTISTSLGELATDAGDALGGKTWTDFLDYLNEKAPAAIRTFGRIFGNIFGGLAGLTKAFGPFWDDMSGGIEKISEKFRDFGVSAASGGNKKFNDFMAYVKENGPRIVDIIKRLGELFGSMILALASAPNLIILQAVLTELAKIPQPVLIALIDFFILFKSVEMVAGLVKSAQSMKDVSDSIKTVGASGGVAGAVTNIGLIAAAFTAAFVAAKLVSDELHKLAGEDPNAVPLDDQSPLQRSRSPRLDLGKSPTPGQELSSDAAAAWDQAWGLKGKSELDRVFHTLTTGESTFGPTASQFENSPVMRLTKAISKELAGSLLDITDWIGKVNRLLGTAKDQQNKTTKDTGTGHLTNIAVWTGGALGLINSFGLETNKDLKKQGTDAVVTVGTWTGWAGKLIEGYTSSTKANLRKWGIDTVVDLGVWVGEQAGKLGTWAGERIAGIDKSNTDTSNSFSTWIKDNAIAFTNWGITAKIIVDTAMMSLFNAIHGWLDMISFDVDGWQGAMFDGMRRAFIGGVNSVIDILNGFGAALSGLARALGFEITISIPRIPNPGPGGVGGALQRSRNLARGGPVDYDDGTPVSGQLPGYSPGHDTIPARRGNQPYLLAGGEYIVRPEATRAMGPGAMDLINRAHENPVRLVRPPETGAVFGAPAGGGVSGLWQQMWNIVRSAIPFARLTSSVRNEPGSYHNTGQAIDIAGGDMRAIDKWIYDKYGSSIAELIHTPGPYNIKDGRHHVYNPTVRSGHYDHVHWAMTPAGLGQGGAGAALGTAFGAIVTYLTDKARSIIDPIRGAIAAIPGKAFGGNLAAAAVKKILDRLFNVGVAKDAEATAAGGAALGATSNESAGIVKIISDVARGRFGGDARQAAIIGVATGIVESGLRNLAGGDRDSVGVFQQRPSQGWGTIAQIMNVTYAAGKFFAQFPANWKSREPGALAQSIQRSGFPGRYAPQMGRATGLVGLYGGFDSGGYLPPGITTVINGTGMPERVLSAEQTRSFDRLVNHLTRNPRSAGGESHLHLHDTGWTPQQAFAEFERRQAFKVRQS